MPDKYSRFVPIGISASLHLALLIIMMLYFIPQMKENTWYELSWTDETPELAEPEPEVNNSPAMVDIEMGATKPQSRTRTVKPAPSPKPGPVTTPPAAPARGNPAAGESELVEAPVLAPVEQTFRAPTALKSNPVAAYALRETVSGIPGPASSGSVSSDIEGGKLIRTDSKTRTHSFGDYGEVKLRFMVDSSARLDENSIWVVQSQSSKFDAEAIKILKDITFGFRGRPEPERYYLITIKFNP